MMTEPRIARAQDILPTKLKRSFKKMALKIVVMTTERAPRGVTRMASTNMYAAKLHISPMIIRVMPVHHHPFLRYPYPSPASSSYLTFAFSSPIFFTTKLTPINKPEQTARTMPMIL
jgi:hypothetical protein